MLKEWTPTGDNRPFLRRKKNYWLYFMAAVILLPGLLYLVYYRVREVRLKTNYVTTTAEVITASLGSAGSYGTGDNCSGNVRVRYTTGHQVHLACVDVKVNYRHVLSDNGMPVTAGDEFAVKVDQKDASNIELLTNRPTQRTQAKYLQMVKMQLSKLLPGKSANEYECLSKGIFETFGYEGLARVMFSDETWIENFSNNSITYNRMMKSGEMQSIYKRCGK